MLHVKHQAADAPDFVLVGHRQRKGLCAYARNHGDQATGYVANANGQHDDGKRRLAKNRANHRKFDQRAQERRGGHRAKHREPVREAEHGHCHQPRKCAQHHQLALGEADCLSGFVNEHEAHGDQSVDAPLRHAADY